MQPYVVESMLNPDGTDAFRHSPKTVRQVISEQTSAQLREILEKVVGDPTDGTGRNAAVSGYRIGGKTGTSEKVSLEAKTGQKEYIVSFVGFAPADDPKIALLVFLDTPSNKSGVYISGGQMAAPVVGRMFADILPYMGVKPDAGEESADAVMPLVLDMPLDKAVSAVRDAGLEYRTIGDGDTVTDQLPLSGTSLAAGSQIILYLGSQPSQELETVPELNGMSYAEARDTLSYYGIYINTSSPVTNAARQTVSAQSITPGTLAPHGTTVEVSLINSDESMLGRY